MIQIKHIPAISSDPDLADEWHAYHMKKPFGVLFSLEWANRVKAGIKLLNELGRQKHKTLDQITEEVNLG